MEAAWLGLDARLLRILYALYRSGPLTKKQLQAALRLQSTTLNRAMQALAERGLTAALGEAPSTGGRKAATYDIAHQGLYLIGVDLSRTYVKILLCNAKLAILQAQRFSLCERDGPESTIQRIAQGIARMARAAAVPLGQVMGIGVGTVGPLDRAKGVLRHPRGFPNAQWNEVPLKARLEAALAMPCFVDNGANTAVLAEYLFGAGRGKRSVAYIHCGVGIRSAVMQDGVLIRALNDHEDALGSMVISLAHGERHSLEQACALGPVQRALAAEGKGGALPAALREKAALFAIGLANFTRLLGPDVLILSGPLMQRAPAYWAACMDAFYQSDARAGGVLCSQGGRFRENSIAIGAAATVMAHICRTDT